MAGHSLVCSCHSVCPCLKFQTVLHVYIPDKIHVFGFQRNRYQEVSQARKSEISSSTVFICETGTGGSDLVGFLETRGDSAVMRMPCMWK